MDSQENEVVRIIEFNCHTDNRGKIIIADDQLPFLVSRVLWIYDVADGRGKKALRKCEQIYVPLQGAFAVNTYHDKRKRFWLDEHNRGLYLPPMTWREIVDVEPDSMLLVLCSHPYDPDDYIHNFEDFLNEIS